jgi:hypothetical protein
VIARQKQELARQQQELAATAQQLQEVCSLLALKNDSLSHLTRHSSMLETQVRRRGRCVSVVVKPTNQIHVVGLMWSNCQHYAPAQHAHSLLHTYFCVQSDCGPQRLCLCTLHLPRLSVVYACRS